MLAEGLLYLLHIHFLQENPTINFVGLLLGPRGNYLEKLKEETKCNIVIRGKGSLRSGMTGIKKDGSVVDGLEEPLHALITVSFLIECYVIFNGCFHKKISNENTGFEIVS